MKHIYKKWLLILGIFSVSLCAVGQKNSADQNFETATRLAQKYNESSAAILETETNISFKQDKNQVNVLEETTEKIITLQKYNTVKRPVFYDINSEISDYNLKTEKNRKIKIEPICGNYESEDIFQSDNMLCVYPLKFETMGEIQNLSFNKITTDIRYAHSLYFQSELPVQKIKITITIPAWLDLELKEINFTNYKIAKTIKKDSPKGNNIYEYTATNLDEFKHEDHSYGISHTYPHILIVAKSYKNSNNEKINIISNIDDLHAWYNYLVLQLKNNNSSFKPTVEKIIAKAPSDLDKIKAIFYWVQDNIRYIAFENGIAGYKPAEAVDVFRLKYGDCKGMANLTKWMLKTAGFDARLVWIGTKSIPYNNNIPSLAINNHMICYVNYNNKGYYLDATSKYIGFNDYGESIQGKVAMVEKADSYFLDTIPNFTKERNLQTIDFDITLQNNSLSGKCKNSYMGESHSDVLYFLNDLKKDKQKELKEILINDKDKNIVVDNVVSSDLNDKENPYTLQSNVIINNKVSNFDNDYYIDLDFYKTYNNMRIKEDRISDMYFNEKKYVKMKVNLLIPSGFKLKYLPAPLDIKDSYFGFSVKYNVSNNVISYERIITIDKAYLPVSSFKKWNASIIALADKYKENVILTKN